ncbi:MAG: phosphatidate cytidylyltransferase [Gemmatimonadetes bacterium]|nr:phosphatidate cytidylyltransferase [Gemmatimonadota bacterium]
MARGELAQRVGVAALGIPATLAALYAGGWVLGLVLAILAAGAAFEFYGLAARRGVQAFALPGTAVAAAFVLLAAARPAESEAAPLFWILLLLLLLVLAVAAIWRRGVAGQPLLAAAVTLTGALLGGGTLAYALFLRHLPAEAGWAGGAEWARRAGTSLVAFPIAVTWINDSAAYFVGRAWGRRRLIPEVSPGKTVEGALAGMAAAILTGAALGAFLLRDWLGLPLDALAGAVGGALIGLAAQLGDLAESLLKREAGVKDSGRVFPGHGGVLDRFDALFFAFPVAYWYLGLVLAAGWS